MTTFDMWLERDEAVWLIQLIDGANAPMLARVRDRLSEEVSDLERRNPEILDEHDQLDEGVDA